MSAPAPSKKVLMQNFGGQTECIMGDVEMATPMAAVFAIERNPLLGRK